MRLGALLPRALLSLLFVAAALVLPATAATKSPPNPRLPRNVDPALAAVTGSALKRNPNEQLQVIVFGPGASRAVARARGRVRRGLPVLGAQSARVSARSLAKLAGRRGVAYIAPDYPILPTATRPEPKPIEFPALATLFPVVDAAPDAWSAGYAGRSVGIAVIDSGVTAAPEFGDRLVQVRLAGAAGDDSYGHGTLVAATAAGESPDGRYVGIAPRAPVYGVDVSRSDGVYTSDVIAGLGWVLANHQKLGIRVVVLSVTETTPSSFLASPLDTVVEQLWRRGVVVVVAAGNLGPGGVSFAPANDPHVITVGALDPNESLDFADDFEASFSSRGITLDGFRKPNLLAPGRRVVSLLPPDSTLGRAAPAANWIAPGYASISGTSFSAPQVAGAVAVLLEQHRSWKPDQVKWALLKTARPVPGASASTLDLGAAIDFEGVPGKANQGLRPARFGARGTTRKMFIRMRPATRCRPCPPVSWNAPSWNASSWNASSWNASSWNRASWLASSWNASSWNASSWNASSWNASAFD